MTCPESCVTPGSVPALRDSTAKEVGVQSKRRAKPSGSDLTGNHDTGSAFFGRDRRSNRGMGVYCCRSCLSMRISDILFALSRAVPRSETMVHDCRAALRIRRPLSAEMAGNRQKAFTPPHAFSCKTGKNMVCCHWACPARQLPAEACASE